MKKAALLIILVSFFAASCVKSGHKSQNWHPRGGKKMKKGSNHPG